MSIEIWFLFLITETALCLSPGPAVLYVVSQGLGGGWRVAGVANAGIIIANTIYFALSATGAGALILASGEFFTVIKLAGAAYLIWLGISALRRRPVPLHVEIARDGALYRVFRGAMVVQLANPKNLIFFVALLPQFLDPTAPIVSQVVILGLTSIVVEGAVLGTYGGLAAGMRNWARDPRRLTWINRVSGGCLIGAGVGIAAVGRTS